MRMGWTQENSQAGDVCLGGRGAESVSVIAQVTEPEERQTQEARVMSVKKARRSRKREREERDEEDRMEPPIQATILIFMEAGARALISFSMWVSMLPNIVEVLCREHGVAVFLLPIKLGLTSTSGQRSLPMVIP